MTTRRLCGAIQSVILAVLLYAVSTPFSLSHGQVVTNISSDGTLGTTVTPDGAGLFEINGGTIKGSNQFHSFDRFSVGTGGVALFNGPAGTQNILSRVTGQLTGPAPSQIDGFLASAIPGANLFLMNPAGIMFGPNAQLDVSGSFHATTSDYIGLADGTHFSTIPSAADALLTAAAPVAFGFLTANPATIDVDTSSLLLGAPGQTLSFVGGTVNVGAGDGSLPGFIAAPGGLVNLVSVASPGEATFSSPINADGFAQLGDINIQGGSIVDGKNVFIRSGRLVIDEAVILPGAFSLFGLPPPPDGGEVNVKVRNDMVITGTAPEAFTEAPPGILTFNGAFDSIAPAAKVPDITIDAGSLSLSGIASIQTNRLGPGDPPTINITADTVRVENGAGIGTFNFFAGPGGDLIVNAQNVELSGNFGPTAAGATGFLAQGLFHPFFGGSIDPALTFADSGSITVNAGGPGGLVMRGNAEITTDSFAFGRSGDIALNIANGDFSDQGIIAAQSILAGDSGNVTIKVAGGGQLEIKDGFRVSATTGGTGAGGVIDISAGKSIDLSGTDSSIISLTAPPPDVALNGFAQVFGLPDFDTLRAALGLPGDADIFAVLGTLNAIGFTAVPGPLVPGDGGQVRVSTPVLTVSSGARLDSSTAWDGNAGRVEGNVGTLTLADGGVIRSRSGLVNLETGVLTVGKGNAGKVVFTTTGNNTIKISGAGSTVSTTTFGDGNGGDISLSSASNVEILNGGSVTADSLGGAGLTGNINITAGNSIVMNNGTISTQAVTSDGGNIKLTAPNIVRLTGSQITTSVESGVGGGGNINIDPQFIILNSSQITANAFGGPGGNITLIANNFIPSADSVVQASSALSTQGTIVIESPENDIAGSISQLPQSIVDVSGLLPERCAARGAGGAQSSFVVAGRGGLPTNPDNYLPSFSAGSGSTKSGGTTKPGMSLSELGYANQTTVAMVGWGCPR